MTESSRSRIRLSAPRHHACAAHRCLLFEVADEANELAEALDVKGVEVDRIAAAGGGPGRLGPKLLDDSLVVGTGGHAGSVKSCATSCSPAA